MLFGVPDEIPDITRSSGGKDLYMGSPVLVTGKVSGAIGNVPGPPGGSHQVGPPAPEGCVGQVWEGTSPRWAGAPPHKRPRARERGEGGNPRLRWAYGPSSGAPPLPPLAAPKPHLGLAAPLEGGNPRWIWAPPLPSKLAPQAGRGGCPRGGAPTSPGYVR